jgi:hypothetical protein
MFNRFNVEATRMQYERDIAAAADLAQFAPTRRSISERLAGRISERRARTIRTRDQ